LVPGCSIDAGNSKYSGVRKYANGGVMRELAPTSAPFTNTAYVPYVLGKYAAHKSRGACGVSISI
jgi:hypothetical protein